MQTVLFQTIQFSLNITFFTELNVKTVLFQIIRFSKNTPFKCQNLGSFFQTIQFSISIFCFHTVKCQNSLVLFDRFLGPYQVLPL